MPVICIRKYKSIGVDNGERFTILNFSEIPDYSVMKKEELRDHCRQKKLKVGGNSAELVERLQNASSDIVLRLDEEEDAEPIRVPRHLFQKHFYVAYAITYFQSQGCTITGRYTIWDWDFYHVNWRAKNVAMSRATSKANVQIAPPKSETKATEVGKARGWIKNEEDEFVQCDSPISRRNLTQRSYGEQYVDEFIRYHDLAQINGSRSYPMRATAAQKNPIDKHAHVDYDTKCEEIVGGMRSNRDLWVDRVERDNWNLNLLLDDLYVIDLDTPEAVEYFETTIMPKFEEEFASCPLQKTRKGFHYFFVRPTDCTHFNKARAYRNEEGEPIEIDCCTCSSTGTRGNINVFPSKNKVWLRSIHEYPPQVMSDRLYEYLDQHHIGLKMKAATKTVAGEKRPREEVTLTLESKYWTDYIASQSGCSTSDVTWSSTTRGRVIAENRKCLADSNHIAEHDNAFIDIMKDGSLKYSCKSARCGKTIVIAGSAVANQCVTCKF
jgi:hypothetical protein